ncbi:hypothetical protein SCMU_18280 [Sinomonas cyclohexanicum]|uniref:30S ribosomal protein S20 n=1 Tax=Sinomonas cyclohexanicum TaxID=322009 RepID=A0ABN6FH47_SINCY|nr:hypothetical protein [Corynebacterium cyclohexanicum]BCT75986.1 hypothetical protein SCMU_18280 [Corynebacterium cyclohexanicum]
MGHQKHDQGRKKRQARQAKQAFHGALSRKQARQLNREQRRQLPD